MKSIVSPVGVLLLLFTIVFLSGCPCSEYVKLYVFAGHRSPGECQGFIREGISNHNSDGVALVCPGEEITICWDSNVSKIELEPNLGIQGPSGIKYLKVFTDTTIKATPVGSCAGSKTATVKVVSEDMPSTWLGQWNSRCEVIEFRIHEAFVSRSVKAKAITALWEPQIAINIGGTQAITCKTPPFLAGSSPGAIGGFHIRQPNFKEEFPVKRTTVGTWRFVWEADCGQSFECNPLGNFPFEIILTCEE